MAASPALAATFTCNLASHPDGNAEPPPYDLRLDELFDVTGSHDIGSFDFDDAQSNMTLVHDDGGDPGDGTPGVDAVRLFGTVIGDPARRGLWDVDFIYTTNLQSAGGGGVDVMVNSDSPLNNGTITPLVPEPGSSPLLPA